MTLRWCASVSAIFAAFALSSSAFAQEPEKKAPAPAAPEAPKPPAAKPAAPKTAATKPGKKAAKEPLPVEISVIATSPDPPWLLRIQNTGDTAIRIPADSRLLRFDLKATKLGSKPGARAGSYKCAPPKLLIPSDFDEKRELFLRPGEVYEEQIDPRLYCFGDTTDLLRPGTKLVPHFGFKKSWGEPKEPFAAQSVDDVDPHTPLKSITGPEIILPEVAATPGSPGAAAPGAPAESAAATSASVDALKDAGSGIASPRSPAASKGSPSDGTKQAPTNGAPSGSEPTDGQPADEPAPPPIVDKNEGHLDVYVTRLVDASAPRNVVLSIRAKNEGKRKLATVLRGRMLHFRVEEVGADNRTIRTVECTHQNAGHGIATEMISHVKPGKQVTIPLAIAEICPRGTFPKPGLYRVTPTLDTSQEGEVLKHDPWLGHALARQSALIRLASAKEGFYYASPRPGPAKLPPNTLLVATDKPQTSQAQTSQAQTSQAQTSPAQTSQAQTSHEK